MSEGDELWVGLDLGTQSVKASVVTGAGAVLASGHHPLTSVREQHRHEQDPGHWIGATASAIRKALTGLAADKRRNIAGLSLCSTSGTVVVLDEEGIPTTPGLMYDDARGAAFASVLRSAGAERWRALGITVQPSWAICRIAWLAANGFLTEGTRIAHQSDVILEAMTGGRMPTDWSSALKSGYDVITGEWPAEVFGADGPFDLSDQTRESRERWASGHLPAVVAPGTAIGVTSVGWEEASGLPAGTPVFAGTTDGCAAQLGAGALRIGDWHSVIGTTLVLKGVSDRPVTAAGGALYSHRAPHDDLWLPGGASNVGAGVVNALFPGADLAAVDAAVLGGDARLIPCYPLAGRGERFPFSAAEAGGFALWPNERPLQSLGDAPQTTAIASLWAGVACVERLCFDVLADQGATTAGRLSSSGGGTYSTAWTRLRASLLGKPIALPDSAEASVGVAILARWGAGRAGLVTDRPLGDIADAMTRSRAEVDPDPRLAGQMAEIYGEFREAVQAKGWDST